jgi:hypothetical protein
LPDRIVKLCSPKIDRERELMKPVNPPNGLKKHDWSKAWIDRFFVLNSLLADSVFGMVAFAIVKGAELGVRELSGTCW